MSQREKYIAEARQNSSSKESHMELTSQNKRQYEGILTYRYQNSVKVDKWRFYRSLPGPDSYPERSIINSRADYDLSDNAIHTNKYTVLTFLPKNLFEQFSRLSNIYFLFIAVLESITEISNSGGDPVTLIPLLIIIAVSAVKDIFEDIKRSKADAEENNKIVTVIDTNTGQPITRKWQDLRVGDVIKIHKNEYFPADLFIIKTSEPKGTCFIETKNLDGETNLKTKGAIKEITKHFPDDYSLSKEEFLITYERPTNILFTFKGTIQIQQQSESDSLQQVHSESVNINNIILRGCSLRNTDYLYGMVLYTGHHTKIMLNSVQSKSKKSTLEGLMNKQILIVFLVQIVFCIFCSLWYTIWFTYNYQTVQYIYPSESISDDDKSFGLNFIYRCGNWMLIFTNFVPISLLVTLEMVRFAQGQLISSDKSLYKADTQTWATVQCSALNEELGQIEYIFSDKTGTLTCNLMEYKKISVNGISYGEKKDIIDMTNFPKVTNVDFCDYQFIEAAQNPSLPEHQSIKKALLHLALNHTIITEKLPSGELQYNASSPDELALVNFAKFCGCEFLGIDEDNVIRVKYLRDIYTYKLLYTLEFNSTRKRNSVIVRDLGTNKIYLLCKGADSIILERMNKKNDVYVNSTVDNLSKYGSIGLRTLLLSEKEISEQEYNTWAKSYEEALKNLKDRESAVAERQEVIEVNLKLVGATAIEDKLQDEVGLTIFKLKEAGIKVWVLTGDKLETAINIGFSCNLISQSTIRLIVNSTTEKEVIQQLDEQYNKLQSLKKENLGAGQIEFALVITGEALTHGLKPSISQKIVLIGQECRSVICCRVSPKQKADVVNLVRKAKPNVVTLAIGDGANDVNMITAAHVGIGIKGVEGYQAARAADFSLGEFKFLRRILLYHGRENYRRNSNLICFNFFKNVLLVLPQFFFGFLNTFSGLQLYESYLYQFFNIAFASLPIVIYAIFDSEYKDYVLEGEPIYYEQGIRQELFGFLIFWRWVGTAFVQACIICFFILNGMEIAYSDPQNGFISDFWMSGVFIFTACVVIVNFKILIFSYSMTVLSISVIFLSLGVYTLAYYIVNLLNDNELQSTMNILYQIPYFYITITLIIITNTFLDSAYEKYFLIHKKMSIDQKLNNKTKSLNKKKTLFQKQLTKQISLQHANTAKFDQIAQELDIPEEKKQIQQQNQEAWNLELIIKQENEENIRNIPLFQELFAYNGYAFSEVEDKVRDNALRKSKHHQN